MRFIKSSCVCLLTLASLAIQLPVKAQSKPEFCQIHAGNINRYVSQTNIFSSSAPTPYRPFIQQNKSYEIGKNLYAQPLFYSAIPNGNIITVFQLEGYLGNVPIRNEDIVTQVMAYTQFGTDVQVIGICVNGIFIPNKKPEALYLYKLPSQTQRAIQEAKMGIMQEQMVNIYRSQ